MRAPSLAAFSLDITMEQAEGEKVPLHVALRVLRQAGFAVVSEIKAHSSYTVLSCCAALQILNCNDPSLATSIADLVGTELTQALQEMRLYS